MQLILLVNEKILIFLLHLSFYMTKQNKRTCKQVKTVQIVHMIIATQ